jgi:hypothetical protein
MTRRTRSFSIDGTSRTFSIGGQAVLDLSTSSTNVVQTVGGSASQAVQITAAGADTNIDLKLVPKGSGLVDINSLYTLPSADGTANQVITTDGSGTLSFTTISTTSISDGNSSVAVSDSGSGTVTIAIDGETVATYSAALALNVSTATTAIRLPNGTTAQRPAGAGGMLRYNSSTDKIEGYTTAGGWAELGASSAVAVADSGESIIGINLNAKNLDSFSTSAYDSALYFAVAMDEVNNEWSTQKYSLVHDGSDAYVTTSHNTQTSSADTFVNVDADINSGSVRLRATGQTNINSVSWYRWPLGDNTSATTSGNIKIFNQADATNTQTNYNSYVDNGTSTSINNTNTKNLDSFATSSFNSAIYFTINKDETNDELQMVKYNLTHNGTSAFINESHVVNSNNSNDYITVTADINSSTVRLRGLGTSALNSMSYYRLGLGDSTALTTADNVKTFYNEDIDSAPEVLDTFSYGSYRGAKYFITGKNSDTDETVVTEVLVVHNGSDSFVNSYGTVSSTGATDDIFTFTTDFSGGNVRLIVSATSANWAIIGHRVLLSDSETTTYDGSTADVHRSLSSVSVDSTATEIDTFSTADHTGAFYVVTGWSATESAGSVQEVMLLADSTDAYVSNGPYVSTKDSAQLSFTATNTSGTISLKAASTSGTSTTVSAWRVHLTRGDAGASTIDSWSASSYRGAKYFLSLNDESNNDLENIEVLVVHDGTNAYLTPYGNVKTDVSRSLTTLSAELVDGTVYLKGLSAQCRITGYRILLSDSESASDGDNVATIASTTVSSSATQIDSFTSDSATGAFYIVTGYNSAEGAASISEVTVVTDGSDAYVSAGPTVSTKGTDQLEFTASYNGTSTILNASSSSGGSTTVSAYRVDLLRAAGGEVSENVTVTGNQTLSGIKTFSKPIPLTVSASDPDTVANSAHIYAKDESASAEVYVRDEAGNVTKISPHNAEGEWEYYSRNTRTGKTVRINMEELVRDIEQLTGKTYIKDQ